MLGVVRHVPYQPAHDEGCVQRARALEHSSFLRKASMLTRDVPRQEHVPERHAEVDPPQRRHERARQHDRACMDRDQQARFPSDAPPLVGGHEGQDLGPRTVGARGRERSEQRPAKPRDQHGDARHREQPQETTRPRGHERESAQLGIARELVRVAMVFEMKRSHQRWAHRLAHCGDPAGERVRPRLHEHGPVTGLVEHPEHPELRDAADQHQHGDRRRLLDEQEPSHAACIQHGLCEQPPRARAIASCLQLAQPLARHEGLVNQDRVHRSTAASYTTHSLLETDRLSMVNERAHLPVVSMHTPPARSEKFVALVTRTADRVLLAAMRRLFLTNEPTTDALGFERAVSRLQRYIAPNVLADPELLLAPNVGPAKLRVVRRRPLLARRREVGMDEYLRFETPYRPHDPDTRSSTPAIPSSTTRMSGRGGTSIPLRSRCCSRTAGVSGTGGCIATSTTWHICFIGSGWMCISIWHRFTVAAHRARHD